MKTNILFIVNPISGIGKQKSIETNIIKYLDISKFSFEIKYTQYAKHASEIAKHVIGKFKIIVAVGGDGSINELIQSIYNTDIVLAIIPTGSGNGLARHLKIPLNIKDAILRINNFEIKKIDILKINDIISINISGLGFDGLIAHKFANLKNRGFFSYLKLVLSQFVKYKPQKYTLNIDGQKIETRAFLISIANSSQFGNNIRISPNSIIDDGFYEIIILKKFPKLLSIFIAVKLLQNRIQKSKYISRYHTNGNTLISFKQTYGHIDGEAYTAQKAININMLQKSLNIII